MEISIRFNLIASFIKEAEDKSGVEYYNIVINLKRIAALYKYVLHKSICRKFFYENIVGKVTI